MTSKSVTILVLVAVFVILAVPLARDLWFDELHDSGPSNAKAQLANIAQAIDNFRLSFKRVPADLEELTRVDDRSPHPFIERIPLDPWGNPYSFRHFEPREPGGRVRDYVIWTNGPDERPGTEDDIVYSTREGER